MRSGQKKKKKERNSTSQLPARRCGFLHRLRPHTPRREIRAGSMIPPRKDPPCYCCCFGRSRRKERNPVNHPHCQKSFFSFFLTLVFGYLSEQEGSEAENTNKRQAHQTNKGKKTGIGIHRHAITGPPTSRSSTRSFQSSSSSSSLSFHLSGENEKIF